MPASTIESPTISSAKCSPLEIRASGTEKVADGSVRASIGVPAAMRPRSGKSTALPRLLSACLVLFTDAGEPKAGRITLSVSLEAVISICISEGVRRISIARALFASLRI